MHFNDEWMNSYVIVFAFCFHNYLTISKRMFCCSSHYDMNSLLYNAETPGIPKMNVSVKSDIITVTWTPTTGGAPSSYNVSINDTSTVVSIFADGPLEHNFTGLTSDTLYNVSVTAINCQGSNTASRIEKICEWLIHTC